MYTALVCVYAFCVWTSDFETNTGKSDVLPAHDPGSVLSTAGCTCTYYCYQTIYILSLSLTMSILPGDSAQIPREPPHHTIQHVVSWNIPEF